MEDGRLKALTAADKAAVCPDPVPFATGGGGGAGGGGGVDLDGGEKRAALGGGGGGGAGAALGGGGGAEGGAGLAELGSGGGTGLVDDGRGGGAGGGFILLFLAVGGGGGALPTAKIEDEGFDTGFGGIFLRFANGLGTAGDESAEMGVGLRPLILGMVGADNPGAGGRGADPAGGRGALGLDVSESECDASAPVATPPLVFLNLGMPPANKPPNCGAPPIAEESPPVAAPVSLLLLARVPPPGTGGARLLGALIPGTGGAPPTGATEVGFESSMAAERSFVTAFFKFAPFEISDSSAPCDLSQFDNTII